MRLLITAATGNVGREVVRALHRLARPDVQIVAAVRDVAPPAPAFANLPGIELLRFDFADPTTHGLALAGCQGLFLLRPPEITDTFAALIATAKAAGVGHIVFLSVQGAEGNRFIPHHKTEQALMASGVPYTLLRPAYFMQNFCTALRTDLVERNRVFVPAGEAVFTLVDVRDIGRVAAAVLTAPDARHHGRAYALTARQALTFGQMAALLSAGLGRPVAYESPSAWRFFLTKKREGLPTGFVLIMTLLHYLPRFFKTPPTTECVAELTGQPPIEFGQFVRDYREELGSTEPL